MTKRELLDGNLMKKSKRILILVKLVNFKYLKKLLGVFCLNLIF
jgi:hypothetical protein